MDQDRRDAAACAKEWQIRQKNRRLLMALGFIALLALIGYMIYFTVVHVERTTFKSAEDMRKAMQGRYAIERDYEDIIIDGADITLTYLSFSHYDRQFAERYGYDYSGEDSIYEDHIEEWDYRNGVIRTQWMGDIFVDKNGNIRRGDNYYSNFFKTDKPRPEPIDPSTLTTPEGDINADISAEEEQLIEEREEIIESTEDAAEDAVTEGENDVQT